MEVPADAEPRACGEQVSEVSGLGVAHFHVQLYSLACGGERVSVEPTDSRHPGEGRAHLSRLVGRQDFVDIREGDAIQLAWMVKAVGVGLGLVAVGVKRLRVRVKSASGPALSPGSAELSRAARRALRRHSSRAGALGHCQGGAIDHAVAGRGCEYDCSRTSRREPRQAASSAVCQGRWPQASWGRRASRWPRRIAAAAAAD